MAVSKVVIVGNVCIITLFIMHIVGLATPNWYGYGTFHWGLFKSCDEDGCSSFQNIFSLLSVDYYGYTGLICLSGLLYLIATISALVGLCKNNDTGRQTAKNLTGMGFAAGILSLGGIIWYALSGNTFGGGGILGDLVGSALSELGGVSSTGGGLQYSFYLCAISGGLCIVFAITMCVIVQNIPVSNATTIIAPGGSQMMMMPLQTLNPLMHMQQQPFNPTMSDPQQQPYNPRMSDSQQQPYNSRMSDPHQQPRNPRMSDQQRKRQANCNCQCHTIDRHDNYDEMGRYGNDHLY